MKRKKIFRKSTLWDRTLRITIIKLKGRERELFRVLDIMREKSERYEMMLKLN